ncbi:MAG TPA: hypothetical protein VGE30_01035 [Candidatus Saccharimonadales bacterium]
MSVRISRVCAALITAIFSFSLVLATVPAQALSNDEGPTVPPECATGEGNYVELAPVYPTTYTLEQLLGEGCKVEAVKQPDNDLAKIFVKDGVYKLRLGLQDDTITWSYMANDVWVEVDLPIYAIKHKARNKNNPRRLVVTNVLADPLTYKVYAGTRSKPVRVVTLAAGQTKTIKMARFKKSKYPAFKCRTYVHFMGMVFQVGSFDTSGPVS